MNNNILILLEGKADMSFIRDYLKHIYKDKIKDNNSTNLLNSTNTISLILNQTKIKIEVVGGVSKIIDNLRAKIQEYKDAEYKILIIQDADDTKKDKKEGGYEQRRKKIAELEKELDTKLQLFLFPNNKDDGDLEKLLLKIANNEKLSSVINCYQKYADCVSEITKNQKLQESLLEDKNKVFTYFRVYTDMQKAKEENRTYTTDLWELDNNELNELRNFFIKNITNQT